MANITRFHPLDEAFDELFKGFFVRPVAFEKEAPLRIKVDVKENDAAYTVHAELPGVRKEDIHVTVDGNQVAISAEVKKEREEKEGEKVLRSERYYGKACRAFGLAQEVDDAKAEARYNNGVLELVLPKKAAPAAKRLTVG